MLEKPQLAEKVEKLKGCKLQYNAESESLKGNVSDTTKQGYLTKTVREFYSNMKDVKIDSQEMKNANKLAKRFCEKLEDKEFEEGVSKK